MRPLCSRDFLGELGTCPPIGPTVIYANDDVICVNALKWPALMQMEIYRHTALSSADAQ